jgi:hypothetical protein
MRLEYCWLIHPSEKRNNDFSKLSKAMGNVFASRIYAKKMKNFGSARKEASSVDG